MNNASISNILNADQRKKRYLVLGGRGFIGSHLVASLLKCGATVRCLDRPNIKPFGDPIPEYQELEVIEGDVTNEADVSRAMKGCNICFHLVSSTTPQTSNANPAFDITSNLIGTVRLLDCAVAERLEKLIFISSGGTVYGCPATVPISENHPTDPTCSYGIIKLGIEKYLSLYHRLYGLDYTVIRLSNPYGEWQRPFASQGVVAVFLAKVLRGEVLEIWGDGSIVRDYVYVSDVVRALMMSVGTREHRIFNIGAGRGLSLNDVIAEIEAVTGRVATRRYSTARPFDVPINILSIAAARKYLGWEPCVAFTDGVRRVAHWMKSMGAFHETGRHV